MPKKMKEDKWKVWDDMPKYGDVFFERATGKMPEMESSKAIAKRMSKLAREKDSILDVGCGGGHYLVSLDREMKTHFSYTGIDATEYYIERAKQAFKTKQERTKRTATEFQVGDIFNIKQADSSFDIVLCANVLLHLPSVEVPLRELVRVTKKYLLLRTMVGIESFRIMHVLKPERYDDKGEPERFSYFNIYSESYLKEYIGSLTGVKSVIIEKDSDFNPENIGAAEYIKAGKEVPVNVTRIVEGMQVNNYVIEPWCFILIEK
jgi:ubiquinone/menaquinone biosynthesis C-methylase UbiE